MEIFIVFKFTFNFIPFIFYLLFIVHQHLLIFRCPNCDHTIRNYSFEISNSFTNSHRILLNASISRHLPTGVFNLLTDWAETGLNSRIAEESLKFASELFKQAHSLLKFFSVDGQGDISLLCKGRRVVWFGVCFRFYLDSLGGAEESEEV